MSRATEGDVQGDRGRMFRATGGKRPGRREGVELRGSGDRRKSEALLLPALRVGYPTFSSSSMARRRSTSRRAMHRRAFTLRLSAFPSLSRSSNRTHKRAKKDRLTKLDIYVKVWLAPVWSWISCLIREGLGDHFRLLIRGANGESCRLKTIRGGCNVGKVSPR